MKKMIAVISSLVLIVHYSWAAAADGNQAAAGTNANAEDSRGGNQMGSMIGQMVSMGLSMAGATQAAQCPMDTSACARSAALFALSMLASMQSAANKKTAGAANVTAVSTDGYGFGNSDYDPGKKGNKLLGGDLAKIESINKALTTTGIGGVKVNAKTGVITTPDGKSYSAGDFSSPAAMKAAGFGQGDINGAFDKVKRLNEEASKKVSIAAAGGFDEEGGSGGMPQATGGGESSSTHTSSFDGNGAGHSRSPASAVGIAGLSKNYNGDQIGVSEDNIFNMMARRYKLKEKQDTFFYEAELIQK